MTTHRSLVAVLLAGVIGAHAQPQLDEYQFKAAFLYNFAKFVEWPPSAFKDDADPIAICVAGESAVRPLLQSAVTGQIAGGRSFVVRQVTDAPSAAGCHILFIGCAERKRAAAILAGVEKSGTLTVGETPDFIAKGGAVNFKIEDRKVHFQINPNAVERQRLRISSKLLNLAEIVRN